MIKKSSTASGIFIRPNAVEDFIFPLLFLNSNSSKRDILLLFQISFIFASEKLLLPEQQSLPLSLLQRSISCFFHFRKRPSQYLLLLNPYHKFVLLPEIYLWSHTVFHQYPDTLPVLQAFYRFFHNYRFRKFRLYSNFCFYRNIRFFRFDNIRIPNCHGNSHIKAKPVLHICIVDNRGRTE